MNINVTPISGAASPCLFEAGDFVRLTRLPNVVGRVVYDTDDTISITAIEIIDGQAGYVEGSIMMFGDGLLTVLTPQ